MQTIKPVFLKDGRWKQCMRVKNAGILENTYGWDHQWPRVYIESIY